MYSIKYYYMRGSRQLVPPVAVALVRPATPDPIWLCKPKRRVKGVQLERDLTGMTNVVPELQGEQYLLLVQKLDACLTAPFSRVKLCARLLMNGVDMQ